MRGLLERMIDVRLQMVEKCVVQGWLLNLLWLAAPALSAS